MSGRLGALSIGVGLAVGALWLLMHGSRPAAPLEPGRAAPAFALPALGRSDLVSLDSLQGRVVLLNFWATWCKPCEDEMPAMERLYQSLRGDRFELLAVSVDEGSDEVEAFRQRLGLSFPILLDPEKRVATDYQSFRFPETYLIDGAGILVARYIGPREWDAPEYEDRIRRLVQSQGP